ncbi:MAG: hypothetical protein AVDCRST_MAG32-3187 [uncultured Nocardioides sp.]|uniref:Uncharacterized protein n=1 Tax=uncultured Nocardioides sp. TaxID=198441 RepID=A0A6J4P2S1_9ACTN|nr:MAG: hypothetical protein AVDCRST_MAG32-3187 [uncultured Nocardioides sp.]
MSGTGRLPGSDPLRPESVSDSTASASESVSDSTASASESLCDSTASASESLSDSGPSRTESAWERRRRLAAAFGDVLPEQTSDDAATSGGKGDDWYREQVPPHHG